MKNKVGVSDAKNQAMDTQANNLKAFLSWPEKTKMITIKFERRILKTYQIRMSSRLAFVRLFAKTKL